jgi:hypothetical protein
MSGLTLYVLTPTSTQTISIDLSLDATVYDLITEVRAGSKYQLLLEGKLYSSDDQTPLADLSISNEQLVQLVAPKRQKLIAVRTKTIGTVPGSITFMIHTIGLCFDIPPEVTIEQAHDIVQDTEKYIDFYFHDSSDMERVHVTLLPDDGEYDMLLSDQSTTETLYGFPIPEYIRQSLVRKCSPDVKNRYEYIKEILPNINNQLLMAIHHDFAFNQPEGFEFYNSPNLPSVPADYIIGNPAPAPQPCSSPRAHLPWLDNYSQPPLYEYNEFFWRYFPEPLSYV